METILKKIIDKIVISIQQCTPVPNFSQFGELQDLELNLPKKSMNDKIFEKTNVKIVIRI